MAMNRTMELLTFSRQGRAARAAGGMRVPPVLTEEQTDWWFAGWDEEDEDLRLDRVVGVLYARREAVMGSAGLDADGRPLAPVYRCPQCGAADVANCVGNRPYRPGCEWSP